MGKFVALMLEGHIRKTVSVKKARIAHREGRFPVPALIIMWLKDF